MKNSLLSAPTVQLTKVASGTYIHNIVDGSMLKVSPEIADLMRYFSKSGATVARARKEFKELAPQIPQLVRNLRKYGFIITPDKVGDTSSVFWLQADFFQPSRKDADSAEVDDLPPLLSAKDILNAAYGLYGIAKAHIILLALELDLFTFLAQKPAGAHFLAKKLKIKTKILEVLFEALAEMGLLQNDGTCYANTLLAQTFLVKDSPRFLHALDFAHACLNAWQLLPEAVLSGRSPEDFVRRVWGGKSSASVNRAMSSISYNVIDIFVRKVDLSTAAKILDLGGGVGVWSTELARRYPDLTMTVFDQPEVVKTTRRQIASLPFKNRIKTITGDFFKDSFGRGYDAALMINVVHCNREKKNRFLIQKVYRSLNKGGRIIIINQMQGKTAGGNAEFSLFTFLMYNTILNSPAEVTGWLRDVGFGNIKTIMLKPSKFTAIMGYK